MDNSAKTLETIKSDDGSCEKEQNLRPTTTSTQYFSCTLLHCFCPSMRSLPLHKCSPQGSIRTGCISIMYLADEWSTGPRRIEYTTSYESWGEIRSQTEVRGSGKDKVMCTVQELICSVCLLDSAQLFTLVERVIFPLAVNTEDMGQAGARAEAGGSVVCHWESGDRVVCALISPSRRSRLSPPPFTVSDFLFMIICLSLSSAPFAVPLLLLSHLHTMGDGSLLFCASTAFLILFFLLVEGVKSDAYFGLHV